MTWAKLDDQIFQNEKILELSKDAKLLYIASITHCAGQLTDGFMSQAAVRVCLALVDADKSAIQELIAQSLWCPFEKGYQIHDYLAYNPSRDEVQKKREQGAQRQRDFMDRARQQNGNNSVTNGVSDDVSNDNPVPDPVPRTHTVTRIPKDGGARDDPATGDDDANASGSSSASPLCLEVAQNAGLKHYNTLALDRTLTKHAERVPGIDWTVEAAKAAEWIADLKKNRKKQTMSLRFLDNWFKKVGTEQQPARASPPQKPLPADDGMIYSLEHGRRVPRSMLKGRTA